jgi:hypothetical protein
VLYLAGRLLLSHSPSLPSLSYLSHTHTFPTQLLHEVGTCWDSPTRLGEIDATDWLAFAVLRQGLMEKAELKELMRKFKEINMDGSGMVQSGQLALYTIFQILDVDGSGTLELNEVSASLSHIHIYTHARSDVTHTLSHTLSHTKCVLTHELLSACFVFLHSPY